MAPSLQFNQNATYFAPETRLAVCCVVLCLCFSAFWLPIVHLCLPFLYLAFCVRVVRAGHPEPPEPKPKRSRRLIWNECLFVKHSFANFSARAALQRVRSRFRGISFRLLREWRVEMLLPVELEILFQRMNDSRLKKARKPLRCERLPSSDLGYDDFETNDFNRKYNLHVLKELARGKVERVSLLGSTKLGDRVWPFPVYCDQNVFKRFVSAVVQEPSRWRPLFLRGELTRAMLIECQLIFHLALVDVQMTSDNSFRFVRIAGAAVALARAARARDAVGVAQVFAMMSDVLYEFSNSFNVSDLTSLHENFPGLTGQEGELEEEEAEVVMLSDESGPYDFLPKNVKYSPQTRAIVALCGAITSSSFFGNSTMVKVVVESADWKSLNGNLAVAAAATVAAREIASGLNRVFSNGDDWYKNLDKFFAPPKWIEGVERGNAILYAPEKRKTLEEYLDENRRIDELLQFLAAESHVELTALKSKLRERKSKNLDKINESGDRSIPMVIFLGGDPGVGKTTLITSLVSLLNKMDGVPDAVGDVINCNVHDKFPASTGMSPTARFIVMNDVPGDYTNFPNQDKTPLDLLMQQIVDSNVFYFRGAAIEDKGVALKHIKYFIITSNKRSFKMVDETYKLIRRLKTAAIYYITFGSKDKDHHSLNANVLSPRADNCHLVFDPTMVNYTRGEMIKDIIAKKKTHDAVEDDRLLRFGISGYKCGCGVARDMHYDEGVFVRFTDDCDLDVVDKEEPDGTDFMPELRANIPAALFHDDWLWLPEWRRRETAAGEPTYDGRFELSFRFFWSVVMFPRWYSWGLFFWAFVEEVVKRVPEYVGVDSMIEFNGSRFSKFAACFGVFETFLWFWTAREVRVRVSMVRILPMLLHVLLSALPFHKAVLLHAYWNYALAPPLRANLLEAIMAFAMSRPRWPDNLMWHARIFWERHVDPFIVGCLTAARIIALVIWSDFGGALAVLVGAYLHKVFVEVKALLWRLSPLSLKKLHLHFIVGTMRFLGATLREYPRAYQWACSLADKMLEVAQWFYDNRVLVLAFIALAAVATVALRANRVEMSGGGFSLLSQDVDKETMITPVKESEQSLPGLQANRVWTQRSGVDVTLARVSRDVASGDLTKLVRAATRVARVQRFFADGKSDSTMQTVFLLTNEVMVCNKHYLFRREPFAWIEKIQFDIDGTRLMLAYNDIVFPEENELAFMRHCVPFVSDLSKFLVEETKKTWVDCALVRLHEESKAQCQLSEFVEPTTKTKYPAWSWNGDVSPGECGTPLIVQGNQSALIGLVSARATGPFGTTYALASPLDLKLLKGVLEKFGVPMVSRVEMTWMEEFKDIGELSVRSELRNVGSPSLWALGTLHGPSRSFKSKLKRTAMHDLAKAKLTKPYGPPERLRGLDENGKWNSAMMHTFKYVDLPDSSTLSEKRAAMRAYSEDCLANKQGTKLNAISLSEAFFGKPEIGIERVPFSTSVGPLLRAKASNKFDLFIRKESVYHLDGEVREGVVKAIEAFAAAALTPVRLDVTPKDELRPLEKIALCKVRLFSVVDFIYNITLRMLTMPIITFLLSHRFDSCIFGYMNAGSREWTKLAEWLLEPGGDTFDMDFSAFDTSHSYGMFLVVAEFCWICAKELGYEKRWADALYFAMLSLTLQVAVYLNDAFIKLKGMPSGVTVTLILNSIVNAILMRMAFARLVPDIPLKEFRKHVHEAMVGDDNVCGVSRDVRERFNASTIFPLYREWGYVATPATKDDKVETYSGIENRSFLKRRFRYDSKEQLWFAPIEEDSIWKSFTYQRVTSGIEPLQRLKQLGENAQREFFLYGEEVFLVKQAEVFSLFKDSGVDVLPDRLVYSDLLELYRRGEFRTEDL